MLETHVNLIVKLAAEKAVALRNYKKVTEFQQTVKQYPTSLLSKELVNNK